MFASSILMCKSEPPKVGHLLFKSPLKELAIGHFHWTEIGGTGRYQVSTGRSTPCVRCSGVDHVSSFESRASVSNGYLRTTGHGRVSTGRVRYSPDPCVESSANRNLTELVRREGCKTPSHRIHTTGRTQSIRCSQSDTLDLSQTTPDA